MSGVSKLSALKSLQDMFNNTSRLLNEAADIAPANDIRDSLQYIASQITNLIPPLDIDRLPCTDPFLAFLEMEALQDFLDILGEWNDTVEEWKEADRPLHINELGDEIVEIAQFIADAAAQLVASTLDLHESLETAHLDRIH